MEFVFDGGLGWLPPRRTQDLQLETLGRTGRDIQGMVFPSVDIYYILGYPNRTRTGQSTQVHTHKPGSLEWITYFDSSLPAEMTITTRSSDVGHFSNWKLE